MLAVHVLHKHIRACSPRLEWQVPASTSPAGQPNTFLPFPLPKLLNTSPIFTGPVSIIK